MIDSETSRLVLRHYGVRYSERPHVFGWGSLLAILHGSTGRVPLLYGGGLRLAGPRAIVDHFENVCSRGAKLVPTEEPFFAQVEADWQLFNGELAAYVPVVAYYLLLPHPDILMEPFFRGVPQYERTFFGQSYPLQRALLSTLLRLSADRAADAMMHCRLIFDHVDRRLKDGRDRLVGGRLTLSDLAFAAASAPLLLPAGYGAPIPPLSAMPTKMRSIVEEMRARPAARFVTAIYSECRPAKAPSG